MLQPRTFRLETIPSSLLSLLDAREAALWLLEPFLKDSGAAASADLVRLPWRMVLIDSTDPTLIAELERPEDPADLLVRRRGFLQLVDTDPAEILLPPRSLPVHLLKGRPGDQQGRGLVAMTRRLTMLQALRRAGVRELLIAGGNGGVLPIELSDLWDDGLRASVAWVSDGAVGAAEIESWRASHTTTISAAYFPMSAGEFSTVLPEQYRRSRADDRVVLRIRDQRGETELRDLTGLDDSERPLLSNYEIVQNSNLQRLAPEDLGREEVEAFFHDASASWRPYSAGMPWERNDGAWSGLRAILRRLDKEGSEANKIAFVRSEPGAGGTTFARILAWAAADAGYPTLVARASPFVPTALEVATFITRVLEASLEASPQGDRRYEVPWLIVFDRLHWEGRSAELRQFLSGLKRAGRAVCVLVVTGPMVDMDFLDPVHFSQLADLSHEVSQRDVQTLGRHLNRFLAAHGSVRSDAEWLRFYHDTALSEDSGIAAFWVVLSFWLQRQFDLTETIQAWLYRQFRENVRDPDLRRTILDIAALSTERRPTPEVLLPLGKKWPVSQQLEDIRREVGALALIRIRREGERFWAMAQSVLGRFLINATFYDHEGREDVGFPDAQTPEHLRFLMLQRLAALPALGRIENRALAEEFAVSIFKIDPSQGHATFFSFWREALAALDAMPSSLRNTSRAFRHHSAVSRRRIAKQPEMFALGETERVSLLERAIADIRYALESIPATPEGDSNLNLYNSLAHAYQDLADLEVARGATPERITALRIGARTATRRAYEEAPDNSFVIETYARDLLSDARLSPGCATAHALEVLNVVYAAMQRDGSNERRRSLGRLADAAMNLLLSDETCGEADHEPTDEVAGIVRALRALARDTDHFEGMELTDYPAQNRQEAATLLSIQLLQGNLQAVRLRYLLRCLDAPRDFQGQLELLEQLQDGGTAFSPQMRLELAVLFQQCGRHHEADRMFRALRQLWRQGEHYVEVPARMRWLMLPDGSGRRLVSAKIIAGSDHRQTARISDLQNATVPFRVQEFGQASFPAGSLLRGYISFGHNGPFLRPSTAPAT
jgi:hypothetical protein